MFLKGFIIYRHRINYRHCLSSQCTGRLSDMSLVIGFARQAGLSCLVNIVRAWCSGVSFRWGSLFYARGVKILLYFSQQEASTSCKISRQSDEKRPFLLQIGASHRSVRFKVVPPSFEHGLVLLATLIRSEGGRDYKQKIMDRPFKPKYGTVSQVLLELVVVYNQTEKTRKQVTSTKSPGKRKAVNVVEPV